MRFLDVLLTPNAVDCKDVPPLRKGEEWEDRERIDRILQENWDGRCAWKAESSENGKHFTYGEVTPAGVRQLIQLMGLEEIKVGNESSTEHHERIVFYDLGSGGGKMVVQLFLERVVSCATGIELSEARHSIAVSAWKQVQEKCGLTRHETTYTDQEDSNCKEIPRVNFLNLDVLESDFSDATHIYFSSLCFPEDATEEISTKILDNYRKNGKLKFVVSLTDLPAFETPEGRKHAKVSFELIAMTWGVSTARIYKFTNTSI